ncbi:hypothetical protein O181_075788 [Austropuccinia psidii MF-1]|uniref:Uncharacterized protein n=1 Tax=Austropuccinia psidii MF-1 TaxID=1389203 RepID=A0A9Q3F9K1_9BASI|nr:hypothetical protein [Austropuccinia psidii MF-1]
MDNQAGVNYYEYVLDKSATIWVLINQDSCPCGTLSTKDAAFMGQIDASQTQAQSITEVRKLTQSGIITHCSQCLH